MNSNSTTTYELAEMGPRISASIVDGAILSVVGGILFNTGGNSGGIISFVVMAVYCWYFWTRQNGQTPGKMLTKIRVIKADGTALNDTDAIIRVIGYWVNSLFFGLGWIWALFDSNKQGWHDKLARTYVVRADDEKRKNDF